MYYLSPVFFLLTAVFSAYVKMSFVFIVVGQYSIVWINLPFIHLLANGHLSCFHFLDVINTAVNICVQIFVWSKIAGAYNHSVLKHYDSAEGFSKVVISS